jgi:hypothetical protein
MKRLSLALLLTLAAMLFVSVAAFSDTLTFVNVGPGNTFSGPGETVYAYPYNFSVNGSSNLTSMLCNDWSDQIYFGESWTANLQTASQAAGTNYLGVVNPTADYNEAAWLFTQLNGSNDVAVNAAIWSIFDPNVIPYLTSPELTLLTDAGSYANVDTPGVGFYTPVGFTHGDSVQVQTAPQQFIVTTPESPMSLMLWADFLGLLALLDLSRKLGWKLNV